MVTVTIFGDFFNSSFLLVLVTGFNGIYGAIFFSYFRKIVYELNFGIYIKCAQGN